MIRHLRELLTEVELRCLYLEEHLTETQIASRFDTTQVSVGRLRREWGIPTITKSSRFNLPGFTASQVSLLLGSMLGDAGLRSVGSKTARFEEAHSEAQRTYLDWKADLWGPYVSSIVPTNKDGGYPGWKLISHGCEEFRPFWEVFYPGGSGDKVFTKMDLSAITPFSLAVWYMDDGSRSIESFRFHVGPQACNQVVQVRLLKQFGLNPKLYSSGGDHSIHIQGRGNITRFIDLISPHVPNCMFYKLDLTKVRSRGIPPREKLTKERLSELVSRGLNLQQMAGILKVGVTSVRRAILKHDVGFTPVRGRPPKKETLTLDTARELLSQKNLSVEEALKVLRLISVPVPQYSKEEILRDVERLRGCKTLFTGDTFSGVSPAGSWVCTHCFPYRYDARYKDQPSLRMAWYDSKLVEQAVRFQIRVGDPIVPHRVLRALQVVVHAPTNFRPSIARALVQHFLPSGGVVLDPCAGYGGRAAGTWAAGCQYVGVDPHPEALEAYRKLSGLLGGGDTIDFRSGAFEDVSLEGVQADLVLTSPPYFSVERYSDDPSQSWVRYPTWDTWVRGFLEPLFSKSWVHLKPGGRFVLNTKNLERGKYPILDEARRIAERVGFQLEWDGFLPIGQVGREARSEPLVVFRKRP